MLSTNFDVKMKKKSEKVPVVEGEEKMLGENDTEEVGFFKFNKRLVCVCNKRL